MQETPDITELSAQQRAELKRKLEEVEPIGNSQKSVSTERGSNEAGRKAEPVLTDNSGSRVVETVSKAQIIKTIDKGTVAPGILSPDKNKENKILQKRLEDFLADPHAAADELMNQNPN